MAFAAVEPNKFNITALNHRMDKVKTKIFLGKQSGFFGSLLCSLDFIWSEDVPTAATDGIRLWWNPVWFEKHNNDQMGTVLRHELDHVSRLHALRRGDRDPKVWNYACDYRINNDLDNDKFTFKGLSPLLDHKYDRNGELLSEEEIYTILMEERLNNNGSWGSGDIDLEEAFNLPTEEQAKAVNIVGSAIAAAKAAGEEVPGDVKKLMDQFLNPVIPWQVVLMQFFTDQLDRDYTMRRPNRRYSDMYLPSLEDDDDGRLECLLYFQDVSGSITDADSQRFNSELKYVWDELRPKKIVIAQFSTQITKVDTLIEEDNFDWIETVGGGGTSLVPVREMILKEKPTAAVIFSDLECSPMDCTDINIPLIWATIRNRSASVQKGKIIHIR
ncbi:putative metallopeptidase [Xanthomonas virus PB119]|nr:putative metallopeptidase [Xanthomonas virus PB119]